MSRRRFAVDFAALKEGDAIPTSQLIDLFGISPENRRWGLKIQTLKEQIEFERPDLVCCERKGQLIVLSQNERPAYLVSKALRHLIISHRAVDDLNDPQKIRLKELSPMLRQSTEHAAKSLAASVAYTRRQLAGEKQLLYLLAKGPKHLAEEVDD